VKKSASRLREMFEQQIGENQSNFYFVLKRGSWETLQRYPSTDLDRLLEAITDCEYIDTRMEIPYFERQEKPRAKNKTAG
jgi:hypothetical protein